jgi:hypothetical protein
VLADIALVARFGYGADHFAVTALVLLQAYAVLEAGFFLFGRWYRQRESVLRRRRIEYRAALVAELQGDDSQALSILQNLCRRDPWDVESTLALACVQRRLGHARRAGLLLRRARRLDRAARFGDVIALEAGRLRNEDVSLTARGEAPARARSQMPVHADA